MNENHSLLITQNKQHYPQYAFIPFDTQNLNLTNHSAEYLQHLALNLCSDPEFYEQA